MRTVLICLIGLLSACGLDVNVHPDPVKIEAEPVKVEGEVKHTINIDLSQLTSFFQTYCESLPENDTKKKVDQCVSREVVMFSNALAVGSGGTAVMPPLPTPLPSSTPSVIPSASPSPSPSVSPSPSPSPSPGV